MDPENVPQKRFREAATRPPPETQHTWKRLIQKLFLREYWIQLQQMMQSMGFAVMALLTRVVMNCPMNQTEAVEEIEEVGSMMQEMSRQRQHLLKQRQKQEQKEKKTKQQVIRQQMEQAFHQAATDQESLNSFQMITQASEYSVHSKPKSRTSSKHHEPSSQSSREIPVSLQCFCGTVPTLHTCRKDGPNWMRQFYRCSRPRDKQCQYFKWIGTEKSADPVSVSLSQPSSVKSMTNPVDIPVVSSRSSSVTSKISSSEESVKLKESPKSKPKTKKADHPSNTKIDWERSSSRPESSS
eukprot:Skav204649  [mRNA]  locus=scaffold3135:162152:163238:+ [translate_table: standard]